MATLLLEAGIVFVVLALGGAAATRVGQSVIPAYILAGVLVGPNAPEVAGVSFALVESREFVTLLSELGVVFLLFFIGLEFNLERLLASRQQVTRAGLIDLAINFGAGLGLGLLFDFSLLESLFVAGIVYISSSAIVTKTLLDLGWIVDPESEAVLGVLVFEDVVIAVYLAVLGAAAAAAAGGGDVARHLARVHRCARPPRDVRHTPAGALVRHPLGRAVPRKYRRGGGVSERRGTLAGRLGVGGGLLPRRGVRRYLSRSSH